jgi:hypothetical protein
MKPEQGQQSSEQSRQVLTQFAMSGWPMQASPQCSHASEQASQARIHSSKSTCAMSLLP